jgi:hypothetical protein
MMIINDPQQLQGKEMTVTEQQIMAFRLAIELRANSNMSIHERAADMLEYLAKQIETVHADSYKDGYRHGLYAVRNAIDEKFGL